MTAITILLIIHLFDGWSGSGLISNAVERYQNSFSGQTFSLNQSDLDVGFGNKTISLSGEYLGNVSGKDVIICGLYFGACVSNAVSAVSDGGARRIILPMKMIVHSSKRTLYDHLVDNFKGDENIFLSDYINPYLSRNMSRKFHCAIKNECVIVIFEDSRQEFH